MKNLFGDRTNVGLCKKAHLPMMVHKVGYGSIWAGGAVSDLENDIEDKKFFCDIVINAASAMRLTRHRIPFDWGKEFEVPQVKEIELDWDNMRAPRIEPRFWKCLLEYIRAYQQKAVTTCFGGHGRTGTAAAALMVADGMDWQEAIEHIRKVYCWKAVESKEQVEYLRILAGELK